MVIPISILIAADSGNTADVKAWLNAGNDVNDVCTQGWTLLLVCVHAGQTRSVRAAGSWKAHCRLAHKQVLRLRSLVAHGRSKLRPRGRDARQERALEFVVRQGDNGIVWHILSFWRETA